LDAGRALVLSGDETYLGLSFESPPQESTVRAMLGGLLSTEDIFKAYLRPYLASPKTFLAVGRALQLGFGSTVPAVPRPEVFVHATIHRRGPSLVVRLSGVVARVGFCPTKPRATTEPTRQET